MTSVLFSVLLTVGVWADDQCNYVMTELELPSSLPGIPENSNTFSYYPTGVCVQLINTNANSAASTARFVCSEEGLTVTAYSDSYCLGATVGTDLILLDGAEGTADISDSALIPGSQLSYKCGQMDCNVKVTSTLYDDAQCTVEADLAQPLPPQFLLRSVCTRISSSIGISTRSNCENGVHTIDTYLDPDCSGTPVPHNANATDECIATDQGSFSSIVECDGEDEIYDNELADDIDGDCSYVEVEGANSSSTYFPTDVCVVIAGVSSVATFGRFVCDEQGMTVTGYLTPDCSGDAVDTMSVAMGTVGMDIAGSGPIAGTQLSYKCGAVNCYVKSTITEYEDEECAESEMSESFTRYLLRNVCQTSPDGSSTLVTCSDDGYYTQHHFFSADCSAFSVPVDFTSDCQVNSNFSTSTATECGETLNDHITFSPSTAPTAAPTAECNYAVLEKADGSLEYYPTNVCVDDNARFVCSEQGITVSRYRDSGCSGGLWTEWSPNSDLEGMAAIPDSAPFGGSQLSWKCGGRDCNVKVTVRQYGDERCTMVRNAGSSLPEFSLTSVCQRSSTDSSAESTLIECFEGFFRTSTFSSPDCSGSADITFGITDCFGANGIGARNEIECNGMDDVNSASPDSPDTQDPNEFDSLDDPDSPEDSASQALVVCAAIISALSLAVM